MLPLHNGLILLDVRKHYFTLVNQVGAAYAIDVHVLCLCQPRSQQKGMLTFFQPKTSYAASPSDILYWAGLIPPNDTSMRFSLHQSVYSPRASMNRSIDQPFQPRP